MRARRFGMTVEALIITSVVLEGAAGLQKVYHAEVSREDFSTYEEEWEWIEQQVSRHQPIGQRVFKQRFPEFEWLPTSGERLQDLLVSLKKERAFIDTRTLIEQLSNDLRVDNAVEMAEHARDSLAAITRLHSPTSDFSIIGGWREHAEIQRQKRILRAAGQPPGVPTGLNWIDHHWDGLVPGRMIVILGRPGSAKSFVCAKFAWNAVKNNYRVLFVSPEMNQTEHMCRIHTLASADPDVKKALGLKHSFRNRALMNGYGYNVKSYNRFMEYLEGNCGEIILPTGTNRRQKMTPSYVESRVADMQPDLLIVDPIYKLKPPRNRNSSYEELSDTSDMIQDIAESYNIPIVVTNQAHRQNNKRDDAPHKDSSFGSDVPVQEADHVIGVLHMSEEHRMIVRCTKSRFGADFRFEIRFFPNTGLMQEIGSPEGSYYNGSDDLEEDELEEIISSVNKEKEEQNA
jgi:replicative DNA helicase